MGNIFQSLDTVDGIGFHYINHTLQNPFFDLVMPWLTHLGSRGLIWLLLAFVLVLFGKGAGRKIAFLGMLALLLSWFFSDEVLKTLIARPRPFVHFPDARILADKPQQFSFPSGHTTTSFAPAVTFLLKKRALGIAALILAALIGFSRIYVGVHYPLDVLGGVLLGGGIGWLIVYFENPLDRIILRAKKLIKRKKGIQ
ncbi:MAG: phosphatase PAP2 family protein [Desulfitobacteriaceae bacterium]